MAYFPAKEQKELAVRAKIRHYKGTRERGSEFGESITTGRHGAETERKSLGRYYDQSWSSKMVAKIKGRTALEHQENSKVIRLKRGRLSGHLIIRIDTN